MPATAGQNQRVRYTLEALRRHFEVTLVAPSSVAATADVAEHADHVVAIASPPDDPVRRRLRAAGDLVHAAATGLKRSNRQIDRMFDPDLVAAAVDPRRFRLAFFHYWHAQRVVGTFRSAGVPCVLDMHDTLWRARGSQLSERGAPSWWVSRQERLYRRREEAAWRGYDGIVAINATEADEARAVVGDAPVWYAPMGIPLDRWSVDANPARPPRLAYYGGLGSRARELAVLRCVHEVMPAVWAAVPEAEFWIVGSNPTDAVRRLSSDDPRVTVTGFVDDPAEVLATMSAVLCPFVGQFGFRSRLIEVLACGVPVVATPDAIHGMEMRPDDALILGERDEDLAAACVHVLGDRDGRSSRADAARAHAGRFDFESTYGRLATDLLAFAEDHGRH
ncbi:MAG: glycosyltransferase family 4 protein [Actinomycetota bacterium]